MRRHNETATQVSRSTLTSWLVLCGLLAASIAVTACSDETPAPTTPEAQTPAVETPAPPDTVAEDATLPEVRYYELDKSCPYCRDIKAIIEGAAKPRDGDPAPLATEYEGRVRFSVRAAYDSGNEHVKEVEPFDFGPSGHGMVALSPDGELLFTLEGHHINRAAIVDAIEGMLE